jgi:hypothetical protein
VVWIAERWWWLRHLGQCGLQFDDVVSLFCVCECLQVTPLADAPFAVAATDGLSYETIGNVLIGYLGLLAEELIRDMKYPLVCCAVAGVGVVVPESQCVLLMYVTRFAGTP